jgi:uroporphyrin-3 C-methyltransferase
LDHSPAPARPRRLGWLLAVPAVALIALLAWLGGKAWQAREDRLQAQALEAEQRVAALEQRIDALRRDQRAQAQRLQDAAATNRVLRDEVLGLSQRGALLEDTLSGLADSTRNAPQALRLDEVGLLLSQGSQRLALAGDFEGARRAYALAAGALAELDDARLLNLRQALDQERAALDRAGQGPRAAVAADLEEFAAGLSKLPRENTSPTAARPAWQRALAPLVDVRPSRRQPTAVPSERAAGEAALQVELTLARAALERGDASGFRAALGRVRAWLPRLWPESSALLERLRVLDAMAKARLQPEIPELGTTLEQLRALRDPAPPRLPPAFPVPPDAPVPAP